MIALDTMQNQLQAAVQSHDWERLSQLLDDLLDQSGDANEVQEYFRAEILPSVSVKDREAFWREAMDDNQFEELIESMIMASSARLDSAGYLLGKDYSFAPREDGLRLLVVNDRARSFLAGLYESPRFATLSIILRRDDAS